MVLNDCKDPNCKNPCCPNKRIKQEQRKTRTVCVAVLFCLVALLLLCVLSVKIFASPTLSGSGSGSVVRT